MPQIATLNDRRYVAAQYLTASNLHVRLTLHQRFSTNPYGWLQTFRAFVGQELRRHGGALAITKDSGLFEAIR